MIGTTYEFINKFFDEHPSFECKNVLDVGSLSISGNPREAFERKGYKYIGLDMVAGANVDIVANAHKMPFDRGSFDLVFCVDTFEHDSAFWITIKEIKRVLRSGGYTIIGAPSRAHQEHRHPEDYWRFMEDGFKELLREFVDVHVEKQLHSESFLGHNVENQIYGWGKKK